MVWYENVGDNWVVGYRAWFIGYMSVIRQDRRRVREPEPQSDYWEGLTAGLETWALTRNG